jgi:UDP-glucose 4-epimerase
MSRKRFLVTGGCGFIGSHLVDRLLSHGHDVLILDDLSTGRRENVPPGTDVIIGDVGDADSVHAAVSGTDGCFHLAAVASVARGNDEPLLTSRVNLVGALNVFHAAAAQGVPVVYASSAAVYGDNASVPLSEVAAASPLSVYGADKLAGEIRARVVARLHGIPIACLRFFNVYGPRQPAASPYSGVITTFIHHLSSGKPLTIHGDGAQQRDFVHVGDVVDALVSAMARPQREAPSCNVCTGVGTSIRQLARLLGELHGSAPILEFAPTRPGDIRVSIGDPGRAAQLYGLRSPTPLREGLAQLLRSASSAEKRLLPTAAARGTSPRAVLHG